MKKLKIISILVIMCFAANALTANAEITKNNVYIAKAKQDFVPPGHGGTPPGLSKTPPGLSKVPPGQAKKQQPPRTFWGKLIDTILFWRD